ncbi:MAG: hypothetical protein U0M02_04725 [Acutalibacteraceae bacterium]|nr:hypothetical protein [Acutalibacteraceae bacterium]
MKALYRIVNALIAASIFPVVIFVDLFLFKLSTSFANAGLEESFSVKFIIDIITGKEAFWHDLILSDAPTSFSWPAALDPIKGRLITCAVCFVLVILIALFIIVWSCCSNRRIPVLIASAGGLISTIVMIACFNSAASLFIDGTINLFSVFSGGWFVSLVGNFVSVDKLMLGGFQNGFIFIFVGLLVWTGAYYLIEIGDTEEEKAKARR